MLNEPETQALVEDLREILERITDRELAPAAALRAREHASALLAQLDGPRRKRWYEMGSESDLFEHARPYFEKMSPFRGKLNAAAVPLEVDWAQQGDERIVGRIRISRVYEGPPHAVHGGYVAGIFDDLLGGVQALTPPFGMTAKLEVKYRNPTPIETDLVFEGWVHESGDRHMRAKGTCYAGDTLTAEATALFIRVNFGEVEAQGREG